MQRPQQAVLHAFEERLPRSRPVAGDAPPVKASAAVPGVEFAVYDRLDAAEASWRWIESTADCTVFQTFDLTAAWQRCVGARKETTPAIVVAERGHEVLFLLPLAIEHLGPLRRLVWLGQDLFDYLAPLLSTDLSRRLTPTQFAALWREICELLQGIPRFRHDLVDLRKMPETLGVQPNPFLQLPVRLHATGAHLTSLRGDWESFYGGKRSSATRRRDRTKAKRLAEFGNIAFVTPTGDREIADTIETLFRQKSRSLNRMGAANPFAQPGVCEFFLALATDAHTRKLVHVSRLDVGGVAAATNLGFEFRGRYYYVLASYGEGTTSRFGPGALQLRELMKRAIERGLCEFDFTVGDEPYKFEWADVEMKLYDHVAAVSARGRPIAAALRGLSIMKRAVKRTPLLWRTVCRLRSAAGVLRNGFARP
jgi:CelD/BcsL family acetyltransferase involved in cellulose biosynthesis